MYHKAFSLSGLLSTGFWDDRNIYSLAYALAFLDV